MPPKDAARRVVVGAISIWRLVPERWRRWLFETAPGSVAAAARLQASLADRTPSVGTETQTETEPVGDDGLPYFRLREQDVCSAYRLLLYREPTESEVHQHLQLGREDLEYDVYYFTDLMLRSSEREKAAADLNEPQAGSLEGLTFYYRRSDTALGASVAHSGGYETAVARVIERLLERGDTFVDVGANIGLHAIRAARRVGPEGRVICFEPNPWNIELLSLTMAANRFDQVTVRPVAASGEQGEVPLHARRGQSNATVEVGPVRWASDVQVDVPSVRLDDELADLDELALLKIDIEGAEPLAFAGMAETLKRLRPHIMMEVFPDALRRTSGIEPADFLANVTSFGYRLLPIIPGNDEPSDAHSIESIVALPERYRVTHVDVLAEPC